MQITTLVDSDSGSDQESLNLPLERLNVYLFRFQLKNKGAPEVKMEKTRQLEKKTSKT
jgi:hypothetical protein